MSQLVVNALAAQTAPAAGKTKVYTKADGLIYSMSSDGIERTLTSPGTIPSNSILANYRNRLINGGFNINQRGVSIVSSNLWAHNAYCMDRWYVQTETTSSANVSAQQLLDPENIQTECVRLTQQDLIAKRMGLVQVIEGCNSRQLKGQAVTLSGRIRSSSSQAIRFAVLANTSVEDVWTHNIINSWSSSNYTGGNFFTAAAGTPVGIGSIVPVSSIWTPFTLTCTLPANLKNIVVFVWTESTFAQTNTLDLGLVQLEPGASATAYEYRHLGIEKLLANRYYWSSFPAGQQPALNIASSKISLCIPAIYGGGSYPGWGSPPIAVQQAFPTQMRVVPTMSYYNSDSSAAGHAFSTFVGSAISWQNQSVSANQFSASYTTSSTGSSSTLLNFHATADSDI